MIGFKEHNVLLYKENEQGGAAKVLSAKIDKQELILDGYLYEGFAILVTTNNIVKWRFRSNRTDYHSINHTI